MSHFPSIPNLELLGLFRKFPERGIRPLLEYHDAVLRNESELEVGERELIAAYVSSLNECHYCFSAHRDHAKAWGIPEELFGDLRIDLDHPELPARMKPVLAFVRRLTVDPAGTGPADAQAVYDAGFSEEGLFDVISVTALYNFMNRILEGAGIKRHVRVMEMTDEMRRKYRYTHLWKTISKGQEGT
ncbi:carboxymuconolactone decarboxylase family protein [Jannaschia formosa]|uniref:carboxymuconolactone decarboxylase family protein n=1 Tax=Jannaschia formosa TaxID=2259592 RepID=UPI000E1BF1A1|nr:peroxidase-related enzyme [Jannaschia formosa]TFL17510.1 peroxidase [Jannaschia formosa]